MNTMSFRYGGETFTPYRRLTGYEAMQNPIRYTMHDCALGIMRQTYPDCKVPYQYEDFYKASTAKDCDLFLCKSNGKLYIPGENELFQWVGDRGQQDKAYTTVKPQKRDYER